MTLYLISANVYNAVEAPKSRGFSFIEIWMIGAQIPILLALVEYGFVLYLKKISKKFENKTEMLELGKPKQTLDDKIKKLDFATMIISFVYFITFASIYWIVASNRAVVRGGAGGTLASPEFGVSEKRTVREMDSLLQSASPDLKT